MYGVCVQCISDICTAYTACVIYVQCDMISVRRVSSVIYVRRVCSVICV